jgi:hypothetical protein
MAGGLLNLVSQGQQNIVLNGNPTKSFFKATYAKYTNFGLQKFRVDFEGSNTLHLSEDSQFTFKIPRYADLLMDCYLSVHLPNIWSPIMPPTSDTNYSWAPYQFKWIKNLGVHLISKISITCGNQTLQEYSGEYILAMINRDFSGTKKDLVNRMIGNTAELNDPANYGSRSNAYPSAYYTSSSSGAEPYIRGRTLYIPLNAWFNLKSQMAFPLVALQYNELHITITLRPIQELFVIRDVFDYTNGFPYIAPNFNKYYMQFYRFLQTPPDINLDINSYTDTRTIWNADVHLNCTYGFLSNDESRLFAKNEQKYLITNIYEKIYYNVTGANKIDLESLSMVYSYMFYFRRSDVNLRNEWDNYTNWPYSYLPSDITSAATSTTSSNPEYYRYYDSSTGSYLYLGPGENPDGSSTGYYTTGTYTSVNNKNILTNMAILLDGSYRENSQPDGVYNYIEKYVRTTGDAPDGLYCYNFCLNTDPFSLQPSGAINMSRFNKIELEFNTIVPHLDTMAQTLAICDPQTGNIVGINKPTWRIYQYNFDLVVFEERMNMITFIGGNAGLLYAR